MKLWTSLLFLHGHIADPALARSLAADDTSAARGEDGSDASPVPPAGDAAQSPGAPFKRGAIAAACSIALSPFR